MTPDERREWYHNLKLGLTNDQIDRMDEQLRVVRERRAPHRTADFEYYVWQAITFHLERSDPGSSSILPATPPSSAPATTAYNNDDQAAELFEGLRWGATPICPKCSHRGAHRVAKNIGRHGRGLLWRCGGCSRQFTVRIGTFLQNSSAPLRHWAFAFWGAGTGGISASELSTSTRVTLKTARLMLRRIRRALEVWDAAHFGRGNRDEAASIDPPIKSRGKVRLRIGIDWQEAVRRAMSVR